VVIEAYSVLTRLPSGLAVAPTVAAEVLARRFARPPLRLRDADRIRMLEMLAESGALGGASYDGLIALEAKTHTRTLLTLDERAQATYRRLGAEFIVIGA
jgi:hypothetical protein